MKKRLVLLFLLIGTIAMARSLDHPNMILTTKGVAEIRSNLGSVPVFDEMLLQTKKEVDAEIELGVLVPIPKDMAGGYTHERHKRNFFILQKAGNLYQITGEEKYAKYIKENFLAYAKLFPKLPLHPTNKSYATGKIFWQCLNDANWLVYSSQAYDCIYNYLSSEERALVEKDLFRPLADFLSIGNPKFFNRIHNHSTWANAAVGMIGLVMKDEVLIERALYGLKHDGLDASMLDNDGGFIKVDGQQNAGFLAQLDYSFSPDGYFTEGPYYLRYAMTPFLLFAKSLANNRPDLKIFDYRDQILKKAVYALLNQTDANGVFFPINDSQKGMSWNAREVIAAVDIAYHDFGHDPMLLSIAKRQEKVMLDETGFAVAQGLAKGLTQPFAHEPIAYRDGADGTKGGVGILRMNTTAEGELCALIKYSAHGMGHGHFDKLAYSLYDELSEVVQDYGAARWVNIDQKGGGRYLPENKTFAKQTIAHNTLVVNETSHYEGSVKKGEANHPDLFLFDISNPNTQIVSAKDKHAYTATQMHRTLLLHRDENGDQPILIDVFKINSKTKNQYDLPLWFQGHLLEANFDYATETANLAPLGNAHGYQHLWKEALGHSTSDNARLTWFNNGKFISMTTFVDPKDELIFARAGANDPSFNLRHDPTFIIRKRDCQNTVFISIVSSHGTYDPVSETPLNPFTDIEKIMLLHDDAEYTIFQYGNKKGKVSTVMLANQDSDKKRKHKIEKGGKVYAWTGPYALK